MNKPKEHIKIKLLIAFLLLAFLSCENREWDNPFDPDCPKELFTPANFTAKQEGNLVKLTWSQSNTQISGFVIERSVDGGAWTFIASPTKTANNWSENIFPGGKINSYGISAKAGNNLSNKVTEQITLVFAPIISTITVTYPTPNSAISGGNIFSDGGAAIIARGVCWSTSPNPTTSNSKTTDGTGTSSFTSNITGLTANTNYYVRAYAINSQGITYGEQLTFKTLEPNTVVDIEGNLYHTVNIGTQVWMVENLRTTRFRNGNPVPYFTKSYDRGYCWYNDDVNNKTTYGAIYNFYTATDTRGLCPLGWHVPTLADWTTLSNYLGGNNVAGGKLKEVGTAHWQSPNIGATNESGFTALPGGAKDCASNFVSLGLNSQFWTSAPAVSGMVSSVAIFQANTQLSIGGQSFDCNNYAIRCIKD